MSAALEYLDGLGQFLAGLHARQRFGDHICLAAQPLTPNGTPDDLVEDAVDAAARITGAWADELVEAVDGLDTVHDIRQALAAAQQRFDVRRFAALTEREIVRGIMLGSLDAEWEFERGEIVEIETFAARRDEPFSRLPFADALRLWEERQVLPKPAFDALQDGAKRKAFTVARLASDELLTAAHAELGRMIRESAETTHFDPASGRFINKGPNLRDFKRFARERLESAGWTPANRSHVETIYRTNVGSAYSSGRAAHGLQPTVQQALPYWQIQVVRDDRVRPTHRAAHGIVLLKSDPFWLRAYTPFGFSCRCRTVSRSKFWFERNGGKLGPVPTGLPDPGFDSGLKVLIQAPQTALAAPKGPEPRRAQIQVPAGAPVQLQPPPSVPPVLAPGVHFQEVRRGRGVRVDAVDAALQSLRAVPGVERLLQREPVRTLRVTKRIRGGRGKINGTYAFGRREMTVATERLPSSFGQTWTVGESWSLSSAAKTASEAVAVTTVHEFGHHIHEVAGAAGDNIIRDAYARAKLRKTGITRYARTNRFEYFAESFTAYQLRREDLVANDPAAFTMVETMLKLVGLL